MKIRQVVFAGVSLIALGAAAKVVPGSGPALKIGGSVTASAIGVKQQVRYAKAMDVQTKGNILFNVGGQATNGLTYGASAVLELDRAKSTSDRIGEAYIYLTHQDAGTFMIGDVNGVEKTMMYTGSDVLGGNGGFGSTDLSKFVNTPVGVDYNNSIAPAEDTASKVVYISPNVSGFQLGLSFTPNTGSYGRLATSRYFNSSGTLTGGGISSGRYGVNHLAGALSYNTVITRDLNVGAYLSGTTAQGKTSQADQTGGFKVHNENMWQIGTLVDYRNWQFGATYFNKGNSYIRTDRQGFTNTKGYNAGVGYNLAHHTNIAAGYSHTQRGVTQKGKAQSSIASVTLDHVLAPGLVGFLEVDYMKLRTTPAQLALASATTSQALTASDIYDNYPSTNRNNDATVVMAGTKIRF